MASRTAYTGTYRKLVLAIDVGTTYSGVSYSILDPGQVPEIRGVTRFPAQDQVGGDSKIPTILYYDRNGSVRAAGAEAVLDDIETKAEDEGWTKAEWFKLHLRPKSQSTAQVTNKIPPLPPNKSVVDIFADMLRYLFEGTRTYIQETHSNGPDLWRSLEKNIEFVLTHPNGWEGHQQSQMRRAAVLAGFIPDTAEGQSRLSFVTEGEASLHYCIQSGLTMDTMKSGDGVLIVDAGGGTIDLSAYGRSAGSSTDLAFDEIASPQCHFQGSIFVTYRARVFLENRLRNSKFVDDVDHITRCFDKSTKLRFRSDSEPQFIKFGPPRLRDTVLNIRSGQLRLMGAEVASFFEPSVTCIVQAVLSQRANAQKNISSVFLVGGFAASDWLFKKLKDELEPLGLDVCRPDSHMNKAVADGAVSFYLDHYVKARISKFAYGTTCSTDYDPNNPDHLSRRGNMYVSVSGTRKLPGLFDVILPKGVQVSETREFRKYYFRDWHNVSALRQVSEPIICYRGNIEDPKWKDIDSAKYSTLCHIEGDLTELANGLKPRFGPTKTNSTDRKMYYRLEYSIVLEFGLTELRAQICWDDEGIERRSPARIVYDLDPTMAI